MPIARITQSNFNKGEIDPKLIARADIQTYGSALKKARNVIVNNQGGVERRPGSVYRADLGASINRLSYTIDNLANIAVNTAASRSRVMDADYAIESANLARSQIMMQAATAMLAQANSAPQQVLSLLR